jgi:hypothetical protein
MQATKRICISATSPAKAIHTHDGSVSAGRTILSCKLVARISKSGAPRGVAAFDVTVAYDLRDELGTVEPWHPSVAPGVQLYACAVKVPTLRVLPCITSIATSEMFSNSASESFDTLDTKSTQSNCFHALSRSVPRYNGCTTSDGPNDGCSGFQANRSQHLRPPWLLSKERHILVGKRIERRTQRLSAGRSAMNEWRC